MGLLSSLRPKPKIEGELARCGLTEWWLVAFTADERRTVETTLAPLFKDKPYSLTAGHASGALSASLVLQGYSSWFSTGGSRGIAQRILEEAERRATTAVERHFLYQRVIEFHSPRQSDPAERQAGLAASERQVEHAVESALAWRQEMKAAPLPRHAGYEQLIGIREQEGEYDAAIELCQRAASQGWAGDWDKHLKRVAGRKVLIKTLSAVRGGRAFCNTCGKIASHTF